MRIFKVRISIQDMLLLIIDSNITSTNVEWELYAEWEWRCYISKKKKMYFDLEVIMSF